MTGTVAGELERELMMAVVEAPPVRVIDDLGDYEARLDFAKEVARVLKSLPDHAVAGLGSVVLRVTSSLTSTENKTVVRSGGRRATPANANGTYSHGSSTRQPAIQLFVDNIVSEWPAWVVRVPILRYEIVNRVLCHELGHHIQALQKPGRPQSEAEARRLGARLMHRSFARRHPLLLPFVKAALWLRGLRRAS
jgi:hypothetical protein